MKKNIKEGDQVYFVDNHGQHAAKILHIPAGEGDLWQIELTNEKTIRAFNPYHSDFMYMEKIIE